MNIHFLGTCSGTEPMPARKHTAFAVESNDRFYWFDAGEGCSYTAHLMGLDLLKVKKIVISHPHMDHVGGLGNLFWNIRKLTWVRKTTTCHGDVDLYTPRLKTWEGVRMILEETEGNFRTNFGINVTQVEDGMLFDDGIMKVTAYHNHHLCKCEDDCWRSFTFRIECEGKAVVYSGDVASCDDLNGAVGDGCDALIMETGHHKIMDIHSYWQTKKIGTVYFNHCGREILNDPEGATVKLKNLFGRRAVMCEDAMTVGI